MTLVYLISLAGFSLSQPVVASNLWSSQRAESFIALCEQQAILPAETRHTVQKLLHIAETEDCRTANTSLLSLHSLDLTQQDIQDLQPLSYFTQLTVLRLSQNQIDNLEPLQHLTDLTALYLDDNAIADLNPLANLNKLQTLYLDNNQVQDLHGLASLRSLATLFANSNQIQTVAPLTSLPHLTELYLADNQISDLPDSNPWPKLTHLNLGRNRIRQIEGLGSFTSLIELDLSENQMTQVSGLASLSSLQKADLRNNPLRSKSCPTFPATICLFSDDAAEQFRQGESQLDQGDYSAAIATFTAALSVYQANGDRLRESDARDRIGHGYDALGQYANSLAVYQQAAELRQRIGDRQGHSSSLTNLGVTYIRIGQLDKAVNALQQALYIYQNLTPQDRSWLRPEPQAAAIYDGLALAYQQLADSKQALRFAKLSLAAYRQRQDQNGEAIALVRVGSAYVDLGNLDKAEQYLNKARDLSQTIDALQTLAQAHKALGDFHARSGDYAIAVRSYETSIQRHHELGNIAGEAETMTALGKLILLAKASEAAPQAAAAVLQQAVDLWESLRPGLTDENKISIADSQAETYRLLQRSLIAANDLETSLEVSEQGRGRAFAELLAHRLSLQGQAIPSNRIKPPKIHEIRQLAKTQQSTLVEYSVVDDELFIWVMQPDGTLNFARQSLAGKAIATWVAENRITMNVFGRGIGVEAIAGQSRSQTETEVQLRQLHELLIEPIVEFLPTDPNATVLIVPQAELFFVPFPALLDADGTALIDRHPLLFAPALSLLTLAPSQSAPLQIGNADAVVVGNPVMPLDPTTERPLPPLPGAAVEATQVAAILQTEPLLGAAATKSAVVTNMLTADIVHLATHGLLDDFGTGTPGSLAFAATAEDTGYLTAAEILDLSLSAQLAVLSACNTGQGNVTGDGVIGLSRSLLTAGVDSVVVTLWLIPDEPTAFMMTKFYEALQSTPNRAIALREAMIATRSHPEFAAPYNWAAFMLYGQTGAAPVPAETPTSP